ncbi:MAG: hypothetical protein US96_C0001G0045 [Candidatus Woesebacteria bacterium GW2011_GWB1_38_5b]|uniref:POTRA domain-containing protein n=1 Tax=Candidatus Woesebacteria bacterium GW2011_GWB1_38_5b TaxID=1618569 RepID=A0A0G0MQM5_9BACT|nr:MAG: hypothetical protein US96_C0001G0045 [Candidatus Woesebacteria bacterium GW2011_GWB1_38_5b]
MLKRRRKISKWLILPLVVFLLFFLVPRLVKINLLDCESQFGPCNEMIISELKKTQGRSYLETHNNISMFFKESVLVSDYSIKFNFPSKFIVHVVEKKPIVSLVKRLDEQTFYFVDSSGLILFTQKGSLLPKIIFPDEYNLEIGKKVGSDLIFASKILQGCFITYGSRLAIATPEFIEVDLPDSVKVRFPINGDLNLLLGSLNILLSQLNMNQTDSKIKFIDLRYKNPVIKYSYD